MQDAMVRLWEKREQARAARNPSAFCDSVVLNSARDHRRAARRREEAITDLDEVMLCDERQNPEDHAIARQEAALVRQLVDQIGERYRGVFIACELLERPIADVAREHEIPLETARSRLRRAWEEFEEAAARWEARQRRRGARRVRAVLFPPWLFEWRSWLPGGSARSMARRSAIACAAALGVLVTSPMERVEPLRTSITTLVSRTTARASAQSARESDEASRAGHGQEGAVMAPLALDEAATGPAVPARPIDRPAAQRATISPRERYLIARARTAVETGDVVALVHARRLLEEHRRRFPRGRLAVERDALLDRLR
jgi:RNA polymerase sigma-70 factor (ECF subfamily)